MCLGARRAARPAACKVSCTLLMVPLVSFFLTACGHYGSFEQAAIAASHRSFTANPSLSYRLYGPPRPLIRIVLRGRPGSDFRWLGGLHCRHGGLGSSRAFRMGPSIAPGSGCRRSCSCCRSGRPPSQPSTLRHARWTLRGSKGRRSEAPLSRTPGSGIPRRAGAASPGGHTRRRSSRRRPAGQICF